MIFTLDKLYRIGCETLGGAGLDDPPRDARLLLCAAAGRDRVGLFTLPPAPLDDKAVGKYFAYLDRRAKSEPIQYIIGEWEFMGLPFAVDRAVLIPRPETESLVERVIGFFEGNAADGAPVILDLCTGSGCIAVSLAAKLSDSRVFATDISSGALAVAKRNAEINRVSERITFLEGDLYQPVVHLLKSSVGDNGAHPVRADPALCRAHRDGGLFDAICANPPYIPSEELASLPDSVRLYEPQIALDGGAEGLDFYVRIADGARGLLKPGGLLAVEAGAGQAGRIMRIFGRPWLGEVRAARDLSGCERVITARATRV